MKNWTGRQKNEENGCGNLTAFDQSRIWCSVHPICISYTLHETPGWIEFSDNWFLCNSYWNCRKQETQTKIYIQTGRKSERIFFELKLKCFNLIVIDFHAIFSNIFFMNSVHLNWNGKHITEDFLQKSSRLFRNWRTKLVQLEQLGLG